MVSRSVKKTFKLEEIEKTDKSSKNENNHGCMSILIYSPYLFLGLIKFIIRTFKSFFSKKDGLIQKWYENGQLKYEGNFKDGKKDGLVQEWFENGQLQYRMNYKNGEYHGKLEKWYENGQVLYKQIWKNGQFIEGTHYKENGDVVSKKTEENNEIIKYYESGEVNIKKIPSENSNQRQNLNVSPKSSVTIPITKRLY